MAKVIDTQPASRARGLDVNGLDNVLDNASLRPRVRVRERLLCTWREAVKAADYVLEHFGNRDRDRGIWVWYCRRIGLDAFLDAFDQKRSEMANSRRRLRNPAASFQKLLNRRFPKDGGAR